MTPVVLVVSVGFDGVQRTLAGVCGVSAVTFPIRPRRLEAGRPLWKSTRPFRYLGRVRERETEKGWSYIWSGFLQHVAGFGIVTYTFRVLYWVIGISLAGAVLLWTTVPIAKHNGPILVF
jgi:hypothetical protein